MTKWRYCAERELPKVIRDLQLPAATDPDLRYASPMPPATTVSGSTPGSAPAPRSSGGGR